MSRPIGVHCGGMPGTGNGTIDAGDSSSVCASFANSM